MLPTGGRGVGGGGARQWRPSAASKAAGAVGAVPSSCGGGDGGENLLERGVFSIIREGDAGVALSAAAGRFRLQRLCISEEGCVLLFGRAWELAIGAATTSIAPFGEFSVAAASVASGTTTTDRSRGAAASASSNFASPDPGRAVG
jgi:hypothetical protein